MRYLAFLFVLLLFPTLSSAQVTHSPEIFLRGGLVALWDDEGRIGNGPSIGGGAGIRLNHGIGIEGFTGVRIGAGRRGTLRPEVEMSRAGEHLRIAGSVMAGLAW